MHNLDRSLFESERMGDETARAERQEFLEILGELMRAGSGWASEFGATSWESEFDAGPGSEGASSYLEGAMVRSALRSGVTNENTLTDLVFRRYPSRNRRPISRDEPNYSALSQEWLGIRNTLVRPVLAGTQGPALPVPAGPSPVPTGIDARILRDQCDPPTARPGTSRHEQGLAIDFHRNGVSISSQSPEFRWLAANAERFGLCNLPKEAWHWSVDGK